MSTLLFIHAFILQYIFVTCSVPITMPDAEDKRLTVIPQVTQWSWALYSSTSSRRPLEKDCFCLYFAGEESRA